jgi:hypothetical protein
MRSGASETIKKAEADSGNSYPPTPVSMYASARDDVGDGYSKFLRGLAG